MDGHGDGPRRVSGKDHHVMTADDPINQEPRASEGADDAPSVKRGQFAIGHSTLRLSHGGFQAVRRGDRKPMSASILEHGADSFPSASCSVSPSVTTSGRAGTSTVNPPLGCGSKMTEKLWLIGIGGFARFTAARRGICAADKKNIDGTGLPASELPPRVGHRRDGLTSFCSHEAHGRGGLALP